jgi:broad specificity phosphatase PhoE
MDNTIYFLRHAKTKVYKNIKVSNWDLSNEGLEQRTFLAETNYFGHLDAIYCSYELKSLQTVLPLAEKLGIDPNTYPSLEELNRDEAGYLQHYQYEKEIVFALRNRSIPRTFKKDPIKLWETADFALQRFSSAVDHLEKKHKNERILICSHAYVINLYFAKKLGQLDHIIERLESNDNCDWGCITNGNVTKDIAKL